MPNIKMKIYSLSGKKEDNADMKLEGGAQLICYCVWRSDAGMNISFTFELTPPKNGGDKSIQVRI